jgi:glycerophosphoryl diester phosphodiesterase
VKVIETNIVGKSGDLELCEDVIVTADTYLAVIDGATPKSSQTIDGRSPGRLIADEIANFLTNENQPLRGEGLVEQLDVHVRGHVLRNNNLNFLSEEAPSASVGIFTNGVNCLTLVGDVQYMINGAGKPRRHKIDVVLGEARAAYTVMLQEAGIAAGELKRQDPGREAIMPFLRKQHLLRNRSQVGQWGYGAIDGITFDGSFVTTIDVNAGDEIVLCSDGYPVLLPTLQQAEDALQQILTEDPLRIRFQPETKGMRENDRSYDDRAYIRFRV